MDVIQDYAKRRSMQIIKEYSDEGKSQGDGQSSSAGFQTGLDTRDTADLEVCASALGMERALEGESPSLAVLPAKN